MAKRSSSSSETSVDLSALEKEIASLKSEIAKLKKDLAVVSRAKSSGGADPRVDVLIEALTKNPGWSWSKTINEKLK